MAMLAAFEVGRHLLKELHRSPAFPNPHGESCPTTAVLFNVIGEMSLPDQPTQS